MKKRLITIVLVLTMVVSLLTLASCEDIVYFFSNIFSDSLGHVSDEEWEEKLTFDTAMLESFTVTAHSSDNENGDEETVVCKIDKNHSIIYISRETKTYSAYDEKFFNEKNEGYVFSYKGSYYMWGKIFGGEDEPEMIIEEITRQEFIECMRDVGDTLDTFGQYSKRSAREKFEYNDEILAYEMTQSSNTVVQLQFLKKNGLRLSYVSDDNKTEYVLSDVDSTSVKVPEEVLKDIRQYISDNSSTED